MCCKCHKPMDRLAKLLVFLNHFTLCKMQCVSIERCTVFTPSPLKRVLSHQCQLPYDGTLTKVDFYNTAFVCRWKTATHLSKLSKDYFDLFSINPGTPFPLLLGMPSKNCISLNKMALKASLLKTATLLEI